MLLTFYDPYIAWLLVMLRCMRNSEDCGHSHVKHITKRKSWRERRFKTERGMGFTKTFVYENTEFDGPDIVLDWPCLQKLGIPKKNYIHFMKYLRDNTLAHDFCFRIAYEMLFITHEIPKFRNSKSHIFYVPLNY